MPTQQAGRTRGGAFHLPRPHSKPTTTLPPPHLNPTALSHCFSAPFRARAASFRATRPPTPLPLYGPFGHFSSPCIGIWKNGRTPSGAGASLDMIACRWDDVGVWAMVGGAGVADMGVAAWWHGDNIAVLQRRYALYASWVGGRRRRCMAPLTACSFSYLSFLSYITAHHGSLLHFLPYLTELTPSSTTAHYYYMPALPYLPLQPTT